MTKVTTRKLGEDLPRYLERAAQGERFVVTRDGQEIATLLPRSPGIESPDTEALRRLEEAGVVTLPEETPPKFAGRRARIPSRGKSASAMVIEDRR